MLPRRSATEHYGSRFGRYSRSVMAAVLLVACGGQAPAAKEAPRSSTCQFVIAPRSSPPKRPPRATSRAESRTSRIVVHAEVPLDRVRNELEANIERRLANVRGARAGIAGTVNYTVDRGPFTLSVERGALVVRTNLQAHAEVCSRGRCYASCRPRAVARAEVPLALTPKYRFAPSRVTVEFTRGCKIRTLGGFLTIDVTKQLESEMEPVLGRVQRDIDRKLPDLRAEAARVWAELSQVRRIPLVGCVALQPRGIVQGPVKRDGNMLRMRAALLAAPELRAECGEMAAGSPLPALSQDANLPEEDEVLLGLVSPLTTVASAFEASDAVEVDGLRVRIGRATVAPAGGAVDVDLELQGDACGELAVRAVPAWNGDRALTLSAPELGPDDLERLEAASLDGRSLAAALVGAPRIGVPLDTERIAEILPAMASSASDETAQVSALVSGVRPADAAIRGEELVAWLAISGKLVLKPAPTAGRAGAARASAGR